MKVRIFVKLDIEKDAKRTDRYVKKVEGRVQYSTGPVGVAFTETWRSGRRSTYIGLGELMHLIWQEYWDDRGPYRRQRAFRRILSQLNRCIDHELIHAFEPVYPPEAEHEDAAMAFDRAGRWARGEEKLWEL